MLTDREVLTLQAEARRRRRDPQLIQNLEMHSRILKSWETERPAMWARLQTQNLSETMAFLAQQRMWEERDRLVEAGMPITDAREEAERNHLLLGPEAETEETAPPTEELEEAVQEVPEV
jgi:hypothetical protein